MSGTFKKIGAAVTAAFSVRAIINFGQQAIGLASDIQEVQNVVDTAFGSMSAQVDQWAKTMVDRFGMSELSAKRTASTYMAMSKGLGMYGQTAADMAMKAAERTGDIASFYNMTQEQADTMLKSIWTGETETLKQIGVVMTQANLNAYALARGINKTVDEMTQAEQVQLRYMYVMDQTNLSAGDFVKTSGSWANQTRVLTERWKEFKAVVGEMLIQVLTPALQLLNEILAGLISISKRISQALSDAFGWDLESQKGSVAATNAMADAQSNLAQATGEAAKEAKKAQSSFDELNVLSKTQNESASNSFSDLFGVTGTESSSDNSESGIKTPDLEPMSDKLKAILVVVGAIGAAFLAWKIAKSVTNGVGIISSLFGLGKGKSGFGVPNVKTVLKGIADVSLIVLGCIGLIEVIGLLMKIPGFEETARDGIKALAIVFNGLWDIILPLTALSAGVVVLGKIGVKTVVMGFAGMATVIGGTTVLITAIGALMSIPYFDEFLSTGISSTIAVFEGLWEVALPIGALSATLVVLGIATPGVVLSGLAGFALVIGGVELVLVALGALRQIPGFTWIVGEGGKVLIQLGEILGGFAGSIINGFLTEVSASFPKIGTNLAGFMTNAQPFFQGLDGVNAESVKSVGYLAQAVLLLTAADVLDGLTSWFTGGSSLTGFGEDLCAFAPYFAKYASAIEGVDGSTVQASAAAAGSLAEFANKIPNSGGVAGFFAGENDIDVWGAKLPGFGENFAEYAKNIEGINPDVVTASADAAKSLAGFASEIPNEGGVVSWFTGDNSIDKWGDKLPEFGKNFAKYSKSVEGVKPDVVKASASAAQSIVSFAQDIPNEGGVVSWFTGDNSIDKWGEKLPGFGKNFAEYAKNISDIKPDVVTSSANAAQSLVELADCVPNSGGFAGVFAGENDLDDFGAMLPSFGRNFKSYYGSINGMNSSTLSVAARGIGGIISAAVRIKGEGITNVLEKFGNSLVSFSGDLNYFLEHALTSSKAETYGWYFGQTLGNAISQGIKSVVYPTIGATASVSMKGVALKFNAYAGGGMPSVGEMFVARENGPEFVGTIGNRTAVANNDQIVESVSQGVYAANAEQNSLLREQNSLLRQLVDKEPAVRAVLTTSDVVSGLKRKNRRDGSTVIPVGT